MSYRKHQERKKKIAGKKVIGVDPAKQKHPVTVLDGLEIYRQHVYDNFNERRRLRSIIYNS